MNEEIQDINDRADAVKFGDPQNRGGQSLLSVDLFEPTQGFVEALRKEVENLQERAMKEFNAAVEADHERQIQREQAFWSRHKISRAGDLEVSMTLVERKGKKTHRNKIRSITKFGHLDRYRRIELYGTRVLWSFHVDDEVLVEV